MELEPIYRVDVNGTVVELDADASIRDAIGGWIERVVLIEATAETYGLDVWADEEGLLRGLPPNPVASVLARSFGVGNVIVGPVVVAGSRPPDTTGCPEGVGFELRRIAAYFADGAAL